MKILPAGAELFHADRQPDGRTDVAKLIIFRNFANAPKIHSSLLNLLLLGSKI